MDRDRLGPEGLIVCLLEGGVELSSSVWEVFRLDRPGRRQRSVEFFCTLAAPVLLGDSPDKLASALGWSREHARQLAQMPAQELSNDPSQLSPGEPVESAVWPNGAVCGPGDMVQLATLDRVRDDVHWGACLRVVRIRRLRPGVFDLYCDGEEDTGIGEVEYMGRKPNGDLFVADNAKDTRFLERPDAMTVMRPPPATKGEWNRLEDKFGIRLPVSLGDLFAKKDSAICGERLRFPRFASLEEMHPVRSHRFLPVVMIEPCGDYLCMYLPRSGEPPFVVIHRLELGHVLPLCEDAEAFFRSPDTWRRRMDLYGEKAEALPTPPEFGSRPWLGVTFNSENPCGELEFLKDLAFTQEEATEPRFFERAIARFGTSSDCVASAVRNAFSQAADVLTPGRWRQLAELLASKHQPAAAIRALENCITVTVPQALDNGWELVAQTYERMLVLAEKAGDAWDRISIPGMIRKAR